MHQKYLNLCSEDYETFTGLKGHLGVVNDKIFILGWSNPLMG